MRADHVATLREHLVDLLYVEGQLAALIEMIPAADHLLIENVAVLPALQGRGLGRRLMAHAEALAVSLGLREMRLYTNKELLRTSSFIEGSVTGRIVRSCSWVGPRFI